MGNEEKEKAQKGVSESELHMEKGNSLLASMGTLGGTSLR